MGGMSRFVLCLLSCISLLLAGCSLDLEPKPAPTVVARFDPEAGVIPLPSDVVRDEEAGHLDLPIEDDLKPAEAEFRRFLNSLPAWSTTFPGQVEFSGAIARDSVTPDSFQVWAWGDPPRRLDWRWEDQEKPAGFEGPTVELSEDGLKLSILPPRAGWVPGGQTVFLVRGGPDGVQDLQGRPVGVDVAFYFLRLSQRLDTYQNQRAFPGANREERLEKASELERLRQMLAPFFTSLEALPVAQRVPRDQIAVLWSFTATTRAELCMDSASQRMPLPFDLLIDPDTGRVSLPAAPWDGPIVADGKRQANELDGFGVSPNLLFELSRPVDPASATPESIELYRLGDPPARIPLAAIRVLAPEGPGRCQVGTADGDCRFLVLEVDPAELPLAPRTRYAVVVHDGLRGRDGAAVLPMLVGHFMRGLQPLVVDGVNQLASVPDDQALRLERTRAELAPLLDRLGRNDLVTAWPFTTLEVLPDLRQAIGRAAEIGAPPDPVDTSRREVNLLTRDDAFEDLFPGLLAAGVRDVYGWRLVGVGTIVEGAIQSPYFLDRRTRRFREDGGYELEKVRFLMTLPEGASPDQSLPVVIFGHAVVTDRRFLLTIAGALAQKGFAAISIDFPFHGERTVCVDSSLVAIPNFLSEELRDLLDFHDNLITLPPCLSGAEATCSPEGQCLDAQGNPEPLNNFLNLAGKPAVMDLQPASGAAFLDVNDIPYIKDHFLQALIDLGALKNSLQHGAWAELLGVPLQTDRFWYAGQSLGAIIGAVYSSVDSEVTRAVLNVPGADLVDMFIESSYFGPQIDDFFSRQNIQEGSQEQEQLLDVARWLIDSVDPHSVAQLYRGSGRAALIQMDTGSPDGDIVIPNRTTRLLARVGGLPVREYPSILHGDLVIPAVGDGMLDDLAAFLAGEIDQ